MVMLAPSHPRCVYSMHDRISPARLATYFREAGYMPPAGHRPGTRAGVPRHEQQGDQRTAECRSACLNRTESARRQVDNWSPHGCPDGSSSRERSSLNARRHVPSTPIAFSTWAARSSRSGTSSDPRCQVSQSCQTSKREIATGERTRPTGRRHDMIIFCRVGAPTAHRN